MESSVIIVGSRFSLSSNLYPYLAGFILIFSMNGEVIPHRTLQVSKENMVLYPPKRWREFFDIKFQVRFLVHTEAKFIEVIGIIRNNTMK